MFQIRLIEGDPMSKLDPIDKWSHVEECPVSVELHAMTVLDIFPEPNDDA